MSCWGKGLWFCQELSTSGAQGDQAVDHFERQLIRAQGECWRVTALGDQVPASDDLAVSQLYRPSKLAGGIGVGQDANN